MRTHFGISSLEIGFKTRPWFFIERLKVRFGETPKPTRETRALPGHYAGTSARSRPRLRNELRQCLARIPDKKQSSRRRGHRRQHARRARGTRMAERFASMILF